MPVEVHSLQTGHTAASALARAACISLTWQIAAVLVTGMSGSLMHVAVVVHGVREYSGDVPLFVLLASEWPFAFTGLSAIRNAGATAGMLSSFLWTSVWGILLACVCNQLYGAQIEDVLSAVMTLIPGYWMSALGAHALRLKTCVLPPMSPPLDCFTEGAADFLVLAAPAKGGAVLSALIAFEVGAACGICVGGGRVSAAGIPGPEVVLPTHDANMLLAVTNMPNWPEYAEVQAAAKGHQIRCVTIVRDPLARLKSLYLYARSGGEHYFRVESGYMHELKRRTTLEDSLGFFWDAFGRAYLSVSANFTLDNLRRGCIPIQMSRLQQNFDAEMERLLLAFGIAKHARSELVTRLASADISRKTAAQLLPTGFERTAGATATHQCAAFAPSTLL